MAPAEKSKGAASWAGTGVLTGPGAREGSYLRDRMDCGEVGGCGGRDEGRHVSEYSGKRGRLSGRVSREGSVVDGRAARLEDGR